MNFRELREKSVKGIKVSRYLENPTPNEAISFAKNTKIQAVRFITYKGDLYVWDAMDFIHYQFLKNEMFEFDHAFSNESNCGDISMDSHIGKFGTNIQKEHDMFLSTFLRLIGINNIDYLERA